MKTKLRLNTKDLTRIALFSALMVICSWISLPFTIPFTMQTFAIFLALLILGAKKGTISIIVYISLGVIGLPVFAGFSSGFSAILGITGGFIWGFILQGASYIFLEKISKNNQLINIISLVLGLFICYLSGVIWFANIYSSSATINDYIYAFSVCVFPYIIPDLLKLALAMVVANVVKPIIQ